MDHEVTKVFGRRLERGVDPIRGRTWVSRMYCAVCKRRVAIVEEGDIGEPDADGWVVVKTRKVHLADLQGP